MSVDLTYFKQIYLLLLLLFPKVIYRLTLVPVFFSFGQRKGVFIRRRRKRKEKIDHEKANSAANPKHVKGFVGLEPIGTAPDHLEDEKQTRKPDTPRWTHHPE